MDNSLINRIRTYANSKASPLPFPPASESSVKQAEDSLGFAIPTLLRTCYLEVGNGGYGPGYGTIGVQGGCASDYGDIVQTYNQLRTDQESEGNEWLQGLLPFCEWGDNIFSCVDCISGEHIIYTFEDFAVSPQNFTLEMFYELWMAGTDILSYRAEVVETEITNPFTGEKETITRRK